ncbi:Developmental regulator [Venturia nashicola]|nr:Developmental regulator [Venturia nashicola]
MIQLGLQRAAQLFRNNPQPWKAVHVAGTNGKGTVCTYLSALLNAGGVQTGRFTSPHLIDRWDCITINEKPVAESLFREVEAQVLARNKAEDIKASEFEILTATAFDIFTRENVEVGVVEVGMGGRDDATNVLKSKSLTIITKMGLDHQGFLGNTIEEITKVKCGIFRQGVPVLYSHTNEPEVVNVIMAEAAAVKAGPVTSYQYFPSFKGRKYRTFMKGIMNRTPLKISICTAYRALCALHPELPHMVPPLRSKASPEQEIYADAIVDTQIQGRQQYIDVKSIVGVKTIVMLDGAHNRQAAEYLNDVVRYEMRDFKYGPITWVMANTKGKDLSGFLEPLVRNYDSVATVEFGPVAGMPWVEPASSQTIADAVRELQPNIPVETFGKDIRGAIKWAVQQKPKAARVVICGSLYLVSDVLRMLRGKKKKSGRVAKKNIGKIE